MGVNDTALTRPPSPELGGLLRALCVVLRIAPDARLERRGSDLWQEVTLPVEERGAGDPDRHADLARSGAPRHTGRHPAGHRVVRPPVWLAGVAPFLTGC